MSQGYQPSPFGDSPDPGHSPHQYNPYSAPSFFEPPKQGPALIESVKWKVRPPAIFLCVVGALGMVTSIVSIVVAIALHDPLEGADPKQPMGPFQDFTSPDVAAIQVLFIFVNLTIIVGAVQMMRIKIRAMGFVAAILAIVNVGTLCCVLGLPAAIWSIVILCQSDVAKAFEENY